MKLERLIKKDIEPYIPQVALPAARYVHRIARRVRFWCVDLRDSMRPKRLDSIPLPPASLRYRVHGSNIDKFLDAGKRCSEDIKTSLERFGKDLDSFHDVLDFGCGCGRTIIWFADRSRSRNLHGTDIDAEAISWCRNNLDFAEFDVNDPLPPLHYASEKFDFVYAISVFTHLNEDHQFRWLEELKRIIKPGGVVLLTVHGSVAQADLSDGVGNGMREREKGFAFTDTSDWEGVFPEWYQTTYHTKEYILDRYSKYFNVLGCIPKGMNNHQDVVLLEKA